MSMNETSVGQRRSMGYKQTEVGVIPTDWSVFSISELFDFLRTASNSRADLDDMGIVAYVHYGDLHTRFHHFIDFSRDNVPRLLPGKSVTAARLRDGDLIVADASEDEAGVGKSVEVRNLGATEAISGLHTFLLRSKDRRVQNGYRGYLLEKEPVKEQLLRLATGLKVFGISKRSLRDVRIPLPPFSEQRAIAEALSDVDGLLCALEALIGKKRAIKQAAMQQLLTGKTRLPGFGRAWETKQLRDIAELHRQNVVPAISRNMLFRHFSLPAYDEDQYPVIELGSRIGSNKFQVPDNAVLVSKLNPRIPRVWAPTSIGSNAVASTEFVVLTPRKSISRSFLYILCSSPGFCGQMELLATGTTGSHQRISPSEVMKINVGLPMDSDEQDAIAVILTDMDTEIAALERRRDKTRIIKQGMMQQLLTGRMRLVESEVAVKQTVMNDLTINLKY